MTTPSKCLCAALLLTFSCIAANITIAEDSWTRVADPNELRALFSDVVLIGELSDGVTAKATYNSDGTAELHAWGGTFSRTWHVTQDARVCVEILGAIECSEIDRGSSANQYRERNLNTGEESIFTRTPNRKEAVESATKNHSASVSPSAGDIARELANPNTVLAKLTLKTQYRTFKGKLPGADSQDAVSMVFQPSAPIPLKRKGDSILFRPAIPIFIDQPFFDADKGGFDSDFALGDIGFDLAYSRTTSDGLLLAGGIIATLPTATKDELGKDLWSAGPEILIGKITNTYVLGAFPNHQWDFAGDGDGEVNLTSSQLFGIYLPGGGWSVGSAPVISYDWKIDEWTAPINVSIGKATLIGGKPWKVGLEINYYAEQPEAFGPEWMVGIDLTPVVQNKIVQWLKK